MNLHNFALELPLNHNLSGKISNLILRSLYDVEKKNINHHNIFLFTLSDISTEIVGNDIHFNCWLMHQSINARENYNRRIPSFKVSELPKCMSSVSKTHSCLSLYELDKPTALEINTARNCKIYFPSSYSKNIFENSAALKCGFIPIAFDSFVFKQVEEKKDSDPIVFSLQSPFQAKRHHFKSIKAWIKKYKDNPKYALQCCINNNLINEDSNRKIINEILENKSLPSNVRFYNISKDEDWNSFINHADILVNVSGGEAFNYYEFNGAAIGKHCIVLDAHCNKDWANNSNSVLIPKSRKNPVYDNLFYHFGDVSNQGDVFDFEEDAFIHGCDQAISRVEKNRVNSEGFDLQIQFSKDIFLKNILNSIQELKNEY
jgi:hypothetical protein